MIEQGSGAILFTGGGLSLEPFPEWISPALKSMAISHFKEPAPKSLHVSVLAICVIVVPDRPFDPSRIAEERWRVATNPKDVTDREVIFPRSECENQTKKFRTDHSLRAHHRSLKAFPKLSLRDPLTAGSGNLAFRCTANELVTCGQSFRSLKLIQQSLSVFQCSVSILNLMGFDSRRAATR